MLVSIYWATQWLFPCSRILCLSSKMDKVPETLRRKGIQMHWVSWLICRLGWEPTECWKCFRIFKTLRSCRSFKMLQRLWTFNVANVALLSGCCRVAVPSNVAILRKPQNVAGFFFWKKFSNVAEIKCLKMLQSLQMLQCFQWAGYLFIWIILLCPPRKAKYIRQNCDPKLNSSRQFCSHLLS